MQGIKVILVGKSDQAEVRSLMLEYQRRLARYISIEVEELPDIKQRRGRSEAEQKQAEGEMILAAIGAQDYLVLLDEKGKERTSRELANWMEQKMITLPKKLILAVGGPYGFSEEVYRVAEEQISLSRLTFNHQMIRPFLIEQIYRAFTIIHNHPYHHD